MTSKPQESYLNLLRIGIRYVIICPDFYVGTGYPNSGAHIHAVRTSELSYTPTQKPSIVNLIFTLKGTINEDSLTARFNLTAC